MPPVAPPQQGEGEIDVNLFIFANSERSVNSGAQQHSSAEGVTEVQLCTISAFALCSKGILIADVALQQLTRLWACFLFQQATNHELLAKVLCTLEVESGDAHCRERPLLRAELCLPKGVC